MISEDEKSGIEVDDDFIVIAVLFRFRLGLLLQVALLVKHPVGGPENSEFRPAVQLIGNLLFFLVEFLDEIFCQDVIFFQPGIFFRELPAYLFGAFLAIAYRCETVADNTV